MKLYFRKTYALHVPYIIQSRQTENLFNDVYKQTSNLNIASSDIISSFLSRAVFKYMLTNFDELFTFNSKYTATFLFCSHIKKPPLKIAIVIRIKKPPSRET